MHKYNTTSDIKESFRSLLADETYVTDKTGCKMIEIVGANFIADAPSIFGTPNEGYIQREIAWYEGQSLNVNDIPAPVPAIWKAVATPTGRINSNYGWAIFSHKNSAQYANCLKTLQLDKESRRAIMIYTRPSMQYDYNWGGMSDFMCTNAVQYVIRDHKLHSIVQMRSNDVVFGYKNDYAWQKHVLDKLANDLEIDAGNIYWNVGSLHVYEKHFNLVK